MNDLHASKAVFKPKDSPETRYIDRQVLTRLRHWGRPTDGFSVLYTCARAVHAKQQTSEFYWAKMMRISCLQMMPGRPIARDDDFKLKLACVRKSHSRVSLSLQAGGPSSKRVVSSLEAMSGRERTAGSNKTVKSGRKAADSERRLTRNSCCIFSDSADVSYYSR